MHRVYLLLRNNKQTGPHSLEELVNMQPQPLDLIWVEGKSAGWTYPSEIEALKPYVQTSGNRVDGEAYTPPASLKTTDDPFPSVHNIEPAPKVIPSSRKIFVSMPAVAIRQQSPSQRTIQPDAAFPKIQPADEPLLSKMEKQEETVTINYARSLSSIEEEYAGWTYRQKAGAKKKLPVKKIGFALTAIILMSSGYVAVHYFSNTTPAIRSVEPVEVQHAPEEKVTEPETLKAEPIPAPVNPSNAAGTNGGTTVTKVVLPKKVVASKSHETVNTNTGVPVVMEQQEVKRGEPAPDDNVISTPKAEKEKEAVAKKRSFSDKVDDFFNKLKGKKKGEPAPGESAPKTLPPAGSTERKSVHRGDDAGTNETIAIKDLITVTGSAPDNWMTGVKNLKITLRNNSTEWIELAQVEVAYFSENNSLLEKKIVSFTNVPPKKSVILPAPDQRIADHADVNLLSATPKQGYVSH